MCCKLSACTLGLKGKAGTTCVLSLPPNKSALMGCACRCVAFEPPSLVPCGSAQAVAPLRRVSPRPRRALPCLQWGDCRHPSLDQGSIQPEEAQLKVLPHPSLSFSSLMLQFPPFGSGLIFPSASQGCGKFGNGLLEAPLWRMPAGTMQCSGVSVVLFGNQLAIFFFFCKTMSSVKQAELWCVLIWK